MITIASDISHSPTDLYFDEALRLYGQAINYATYNVPKFKNTNLCVFQT